MNRSRLLSIAVFGLLLINLGTLAFLYFSQHEPHGGGHHPPMHRGEGPKQLIIERLQFNEKQKEDYELLVEQHKTARRALHEENRHLQDALFNLLKDSTISSSSKDSLLSRLATNERNMDELNFDHFQKIRSLCKDEQLESFNALVEDMGELFKPAGPPR